MNEFQTVILLLTFGLLVVIGSVWLSVMCGETKAMMEYLKNLGTLLFGAALTAIQQWRKATQTQTTEPDKTTQTTTTTQG